MRLSKRYLAISIVILIIGLVVYIVWTTKMPKNESQRATQRQINETYQK